MPDLGDMLKLILPLVLMATWVMSFLFNKDQQPQQRPGPTRIPPGDDLLARSATSAEGGPLVVVRNPRTGQDIVIIGGEHPASRAQRPGRPPRPREADPRKAPRAKAPEKAPAPIVPNKVAVPSLIKGSGIGGPQPPAPPPQARSGRLTPAAAAASAALHSPERVREAFILAEILKPPLALRPPRS